MYTLHAVSRHVCGPPAEYIHKYCFAALQPTLQSGSRDVTVTKLISVEMMVFPARFSRGQGYAQHRTLWPGVALGCCAMPQDHRHGTELSSWGSGVTDEHDGPVQDSADAIDNMHNAELYGRVLRCNYAQPMKIKGGDKGFSHQPVWADADDWYERAAAENELAELEETQLKKAEAEKIKAGQIQKDPMEEAEAAAMSGR